MQTARKSISMISATGRSPPIAAPMAAPTMACSLIGVARTRCVPYLEDSPRVTPNTPPPGSAMSSPSRTTRSSLARASSSAALSAWANFIVVSAGRAASVAGEVIGLPPDRRR
jgi:hypothetical protein